MKWQIALAEGWRDRALQHQFELENAGTGFFKSYHLLETQVEFEYARAQFDFWYQVIRTGQLDRAGAVG